MQNKKISVIAIFILALLLVNGGLAYVFAQKSASQEKESMEDSEEEKAQAQQDQDNAKGSKETNAKEEIKKELTPPAPVVEIKRLESEKPAYSIELRGVELADLFRVIAHDYNLNILVDKDVQGKITASFTNISLEDAIEAIAEMSNLVVEKKGVVLKVSPHLVTKVIVLKFIEAKKLLESSRSQTAPAAAQPAGQAAPGSAQAAAEAGAAAATVKQESTIYDLLSSKGKILLGQQPNSVIIIDYPPNAEKIESFLKSIDQKMTSKVFKLKYLKASEVVGVDAAGQTGASGSYGTGSTSAAAGTSGSAAKK